MQIIYLFPLEKGGGMSLPSNQCAFLLTKNALLFPELPFYFQKCLLFRGIAHLFSGSVFLFLKNALLFLEIPFNFPELSYFYLLRASFSKNAFL